ncbi:hypothetical protein Tdes44962_MAKER09831 [Teratosphaeria destructans]|uniref:DUF202 domain-containing protein n=1 Tax=Teratosphaeria destructans TaxID=418781 RepID=A0A9W7SR51_9PEZI|nr:hypothetical protein Tdes44962_MAKER09831 [Teratosphaeria destructans]
MDHSGLSQDAIPEPEPAYTTGERPETASDDEREATELHGIKPHDETRRISRIISPDEPTVNRWDPVRRFWRHHVRISVPHDDCRDHLANERTYLGYYRTSAALSMLGAVISQLYRLQHVAQPSAVFGYYLLSKPIACLFQGSAIFVVLLGTIRFYRQQKAMSVGKVHAGGWEVIAMSVFMFLLLLATFAIHVGIDVYKMTG